MRVWKDAPAPSIMTGSSKQPGLFAGFRTGCARSRQRESSLKCRNSTPSRSLRASGSSMQFEGSLARGWISSVGPECFSASAARAIAQKHSADELAEPLNEFSSQLEEGGFARLESWPLEPRRTMIAELQSMRRLEFLLSELNRYLADIPGPPPDTSRIEG